MAQDHTFRVSNERTGHVAYEGESYHVAATIQYNENTFERAEGREPFYRMWLLDSDGIGCIVNTQVPGIH